MNHVMTSPRSKAGSINRRRVYVWHAVRFVLFSIAAICSVHSFRRQGDVLPKVSGRIGAASENGMDAINFRCKMPEALRLQGNCWLSGAIGTYTGTRTASGKMVDAHSQFGEDEFLLEHFFFGKAGGTFLEMGALDGLKLSNSYFFEAQLGWRGVMIEGSPVNAERLVANRPLALTVNAMICGEPRQMHWLDKGGVSGAIELMPARLVDAYHGGAARAAASAGVGVPCLPLGALLRRMGVRHVDLFSLDVEGAELSVLRTVDWAAFTASVVLVETVSATPHDTPPVALLRAAGYLPYGLVRKNYVLLHPRFADTLPRPLKRPPRMAVPPGSEL